MMVMCINDANYNSVFESIRDVNMKHISSVDSNSFWGDAQYGGEMLKDILSKKDNKNNQSHSTYSAQYSQPNINIVINDYSN